VTSTVASGASFSIGSRAVTYTVTDTAGLKETCSFTVTVKDVTAPALSCPANVAIDTDAGIHTGKQVGGLGHGINLTCLDRYSQLESSQHE
jgi:hypothetical protein